MSGSSSTALSDISWALRHLIQISGCMVLCALTRYRYLLFWNGQRQIPRRSQDALGSPLPSMEHFHKSYLFYALRPKQGWHFMDRPCVGYFREIIYWCEFTTDQCINDEHTPKICNFVLKKRWKHTLRWWFYHYETYENILKFSF